MMYKVTIKTLQEGSAKVLAAMESPIPAEVAAFLRKQAAEIRKQPYSAPMLSEEEPLPGFKEPTDDADR